MGPGRAREGAAVPSTERHVILRLGLVLSLTSLLGALGSLILLGLGWALAEIRPWW